MEYETRMANESEKFMESLKLYKSLAEFRKTATLGKSGKNPMFKSQYSTLGDVLTALNNIDEFGLSFEQHFDDITLVTTVVHLDTGESFSSHIPINPEKNTPQSFISCVTYLRRATLMTMFGLNADDDDGNLASGSGAALSRPKPQPKTPAVSSFPAAGVTSNSDLKNELDKCEDVRSINALYTRLFKSVGIEPTDAQLALFSQQKESLSK